MFAVDEAVYTPNSTVTIKAMFDVAPTTMGTYMLYPKFTRHNNGRITSKIYAKKYDGTDAMDVKRMSKAFWRNRMGIYMGGDVGGVAGEYDVVIRGRVAGMMNSHDKNNLVTSTTNASVISTEAPSITNVDNAFGVFESHGAGLIRNWYII